MIGSGLAGAAVERGGFEENSRVCSLEPLSHILRFAPGRGFREAIGEKRRRIEAFRISDPADAPRSDARESPFDAIGAAEHVGLGHQEPHEFLAYISEANKRDIECANWITPIKMGLTPRQGFAAG